MTGLTLTHRQLSVLVDPVIPFALEAGEVSRQLGTVRVRQCGGFLIAEALGRYQAGLCRRPHAAKPRGFDVVFPVDTLTHLLAITSGFDGGRLITFTPDGSVVTVIVSSMPGVGASAHKIDVPPVSSFPDVPKALRRNIENSWSSDRVLVHPSRLEDFTRAHVTENNRDQHPLAIHPGETETSALVVTCGDHFMGLMAAAGTLRKATKIQAGTTRPPELDDWARLLP